MQSTIGREMERMARATPGIEVVMPGTGERWIVTEDDIAYARRFLAMSTLYAAAGLRDANLAQACVNVWPEMREWLNRWGRSLLALNGGANN